jgi:methionine aminopeptidase
MRSSLGITTDEIDKVVHEATLKRNAYPSPLGYGGFPKSCCTSVNDVMCHGIPDSTILCDGDIVNIDVTVYYDGFHGSFFFFASLSIFSVQFFLYLQGTVRRLY